MYKQSSPDSRKLGRMTISLPSAILSIKSKSAFQNLDDAMLHSSKFHLINVSQISNIAKP